MRTALAARGMRVGLCASAGVATVVTDGLVLHYDAAVTGESNTVVDLAGAGAPNGALQGASPKLASGTPTAYKLERNNFVIVSETATLRIAQPTVEFWGYLVSGAKTAPPWGSPATQNTSLVGYAVDTAPYYRYRLSHVSNSNSVSFGVTVGSPATYHVASATALAKPMWAHVVGTYNGETIILYVNGYEVARNETPSGNIQWPSYTHWNIGTWEDNSISNPYSETNYDGNKWSIVRLYNRALTAAEVSRNWIAQRSRFGY